MEENNKGSKLHLDLRLREGAKKRYKTDAKLKKVQDIHQAEEDTSICIRKVKLSVVKVYKVAVSDNV